MGCCERRRFALACEETHTFIVVDLDDQLSESGERCLAKGMKEKHHTDTADDQRERSQHIIKVRSSTWDRKNNRQAVMVMPRTSKGGFKSYTTFVTLRMGVTQIERFQD
jgi:hypothetical protein